MNKDYQQPRDSKGKFVNEFHPFIPLFSDVWKWQRTSTEYRVNKKKELGVQPGPRTPVNKLESIDALPSDAIVWLGHASFLFRLGGYNILIDPVVGKLAAFAKRYSDFPLPLNQLKNIDTILVSHDHRDHCDTASLKLIVKQNPRVRVYTGLGMQDLFRPYKTNIQYEEQGWYGVYNTEDRPYRITYLPTRHWGRRGLWDTNQRLWGAFWIEYMGQKIFFGGDTGYDEEQFKKIKKEFGSPDLYIVGIGAFAPEWFMGSNHMSPADAIKAMKILQPEKVVPMHYGTFDLSDESPFLPPTQLHELAKGTVWEERIGYPLPGQVFFC